MSSNPNAPSRPALRYHGGKWRLAPWIISHFPAHQVYVEPFGGSAAVLLQKKRSFTETYNDADGEVVNYFRVLRDHEGELIRRIKLTPYAAEEFHLSYEPDPDPIERARRFYVRAYMAIAGPTAQWSTGWRRTKVVKLPHSPPARSFMRVDHLHDAAERFRGVSIERDDALAVIERYDHPETLFYLDPPYLPRTRSKWGQKAYSHEMDGPGHEQLAELLNQLTGMIVLSGYPSEFYDGLYADWACVTTQARTNNNNMATECLWLSPYTWQRLQHEDLPLFRSGTD